MTQGSAGLITGRSVHLPFAYGGHPVLTSDPDP
jgi:hypothetical protein